MGALPIMSLKAPISNRTLEAIGRFGERLFCGLIRNHRNAH